MMPMLVCCPTTLVTTQIQRRSRATTRDPRGRTMTTRDQRKRRRTITTWICRKSTVHMVRGMNSQNRRKSLLAQGGCLGLPFPLDLSLYPWCPLRITFRPVQKASTSLPRLRYVINFMAQSLILTRNSTRFQPTVRSKSNRAHSSLSSW